jgi:hypothetical protein
LPEVLPVNPRAIVHGRQVRRTPLEVVGDAALGCVRGIARTPESIAAALSGDPGGVDRAVTWTLATIIGALGVAAIAVQLWLRFGPRP